MVLYTGLDAHPGFFTWLNTHYQAEHMPPEAFANSNLVGAGDVYLVGPGSAHPLKAVQAIAAADKLLSILLLAHPDQYESTKRALLFAAFVGKNAMCIPFQPDTELTAVLEQAIQRTRQRRSFQKLSVQPPITVSKAAHQPSFLGSLLEQAPIGVLLLNQQLEVINFNQRAKEWFGYRLHHPVVRLSHLFAPEYVNQVGAMLQTGAQQKPLTTNIEQRWLELSTTPVMDEGGKNQYFLLLNDVTLARQEELRTRTILEALPLMAWTTNELGEMAYFTRNWYHYTGQTETQAAGRGWQEVIHPDDIAALTTKWQQGITSGLPTQLAARYRRQDGLYRWHLTRTAPIRDVGNKIAFWVGTCTDIHDQVLQTEELERKVKERTRLLEESNSELEQFAYVASHDLQEPLRKIRIFADRLVLKSAAQLDEDARLYLRKIEDTAAGMSQSLKDLLHFTRLRQEEKSVPVDLNLIMRQVLFDLELIIQQKQATIELGNLPTVAGATVEMKLLFYNLVGNALKFSRPGIPPHIQIRAQPVERKEGYNDDVLQSYQEYVEIQVKDNGIGFEQEYASQVFTLFKRLHSKSAFPGSGIGLALVKKVVAKHKGLVYARSEVNQGTTFFVILPV